MTCINCFFEGSSVLENLILVGKRMKLKDRIEILEEKAIILRVDVRTLK
jgi:hypothetical protein